MLQSMGSLSVGRNWANELNFTPPFPLFSFLLKYYRILNVYCYYYLNLSRLLFNMHFKFSSHINNYLDYEKLRIYFIIPRAVILRVRSLIHWWAIWFFLMGSSPSHKCCYHCAKLLSCVWLFATPWTVACQVRLSMEFSRQEYWNGLPFPPPGDLPNPGIEPSWLVSPALAGGFFITVPPGKPHPINV